VKNHQHEGGYTPVVRSKSPVVQSRRVSPPPALLAMGLPLVGQWVVLFLAGDKWCKPGRRECFNLSEASVGWRHKVQAVLLPFILRRYHVCMGFLSRAMASKILEHAALIPTLRWESRRMLLQAWVQLQAQLAAHRARARDGEDVCLLTALAAPLPKRYAGSWRARSRSRSRRRARSESRD